MPRPVQAMKWELDGSSSRATRNCQSCSEPLRWYDGPSRYRPDSCLMSPAEHAKMNDCALTGNDYTESSFVLSWTTYLPPFQAPRRYHRRNASPLCQTYNLENKRNKGSSMENSAKPICAPSQHPHISSLVPSVLLV